MFASYRVYRPTTLVRPVPIVVFLHGGFGTGAQAESAYGWDGRADLDHFLVVYPDGTDRAWNAGGNCCGQPNRSNVDDVAAIEAIVATVRQRLAVGGETADPNRVFATGISNGGIMSYRLACETTTFAAIGPDAATMLVDCPTPAPVSVIHVHGLSDTRVPFDGSVGEGVAHIDGPPINDVIARWRAVDGCGEPVLTADGPVSRSTANCPNGRAVDLITITGAGHQWPGGEGKPLLEKLLQTDSPSSALDATAVIWQFFAAHPRVG